MTPHKYILCYFQSPRKQRQGFPYHNCCPPEDLQHDLSVFLNAFVVTCFLWIGLYPCLSYHAVMTFAARSKMAIPQALFTFSPFCWTVGIAGKMSCLSTITSCLPQLIFRAFFFLFLRCFNIWSTGHVLYLLACHFQSSHLLQDLCQSELFSFQ